MEVAITGRHSVVRVLLPVLQEDIRLRVVRVVASVIVTLVVVNVVVVKGVYMS